MEFNKLDIKNKVTQSNDLIVAQYKLSPNEQKIILLLISLIQPNDTKFKSYKLRVKDLADILWIKNNKFYSEIKTITGNLASRLINITSPEKDLQITWLSSAEYFKNEWYVELSIDPKLRPYLLNLKSNFLSYDLLIAIRFKSSYTIRIFQLLSNNRKYKKKNFTFSLDYLRGLFRLEKNQYPLFANFKARILEPARKELEDKHKDFYFQYNELKEWRKITRIKFNIIASNKKLSHPEKVIDPLIMAELSSWISNINEYIEKHWTSIIENNFKYFKEILDKWKIKAKENPTAFLIKAIENNYAWNLPSKDLLKSKFDIERKREEEGRKKAERKIQCTTG